MTTRWVLGALLGVAQQHAIEGSMHVTECSVTPYRTSPPSSGNHYPVWAAYKTYAAPIPEGYWVHDLEHGGVVLSYNCPAGCAADVAAAAQMLDALPGDPLCTGSPGPRRRAILVPDPKLDVAFAASAWGWTLRASCFDADVFSAFVRQHYGRGPEDLCVDGQDLSLGVKPGCGAP